MKKPFLFVKAQSRLGLLHSPKGETHLNIGVETGPDFVLDANFLRKFIPNEIITFEFTSPELVSPPAYFQVLATEYQQFIGQITQKLDQTQKMITIGGDHSVCLGSIAAILKVHNPQTTGIIMIDSHGDIHQPSSSPTGNFHGMWLRPLIDTFEDFALNALVFPKVPPTNLMYLGNLDIEPAEQAYINNHAITILQRDQLGTSSAQQTLSTFAKTKTHIHISIDIDAFSHEYAPATGMMITDGLAPHNVIPILEELKTHPSVSVDLVEVNPQKAGRDQTVALAQKLLTTLVT